MYDTKENLLILEAKSRNANESEYPYCINAVLRPRRDTKPHRNIFTGTLINDVYILCERQFNWLDIMINFSYSSYLSRDPYRAAV